jgi:hypothetical protein
MSRTVYRFPAGCDGDGAWITAHSVGQFCVLNDQVLTPPIQDSDLRLSSWTMDSRIVSREIRHEVWPALQKEGFQTRRSRTAWKHSEKRIWVVHFQSFNSYFSLVDRCTTFSFALHLGIYVPALDSDAQIPSPTPRVHDCHLQRSLCKTIHQQNYRRPDIWYVDPSGGNVLEVLADARSVLFEDGMPWFRRFDDDQEVMRTLIHDEPSDSLFGIGARWSPRRKLLIGRFAVAIGQEDLGIRVLREGEAELRSIQLQMESLRGNRRRREKEN